MQHAEKEEKRQKAVRGHLDSDAPLNLEEGERQVDLVSVVLKDIPFDVC